MSDIYVENGYKNRADYLRKLGEELGAPWQAVIIMADVLGPTEDFDGLVTMLEDYVNDEGV